jgi:hypothetical protein
MIDQVMIRAHENVMKWEQSVAARTVGSLSLWERDGVRGYGLSLK